MIGAFVPWSDNSNSPGYIIDGTGCHMWIGAVNNQGYAQANVKGKRVLVHRLRYEMEVRPVPDGYELDHFACDNGRNGCVNPHHCRPVSHRENTLRSNSIAAKNRSKTHCLRGHPLTPENLVPWFWENRGQRSCRLCWNLRSRKYREATRLQTQGRKVRIQELRNRID